MSSYVMVSVDSGVPWPIDETAVSFSGREIRLIPPTFEPDGRVRAFPMAVLEYQKGEAQEELVRVIRRFFNVLAWRDQTYIREVDVTYGAPLRHGTRIPGNSTTPHFDIRRLADADDPSARIALALFREGLALEHIHVAYSFLSFYKVINVRFASGAEQIRWINESWRQLTLAEAVERLSVINRDSIDVGEYLYVSGRCAVAHAAGNPLIDPDNIEDQQRLSRDKPVVRALASLLIQSQWGMPAPLWQAAF